MLGDLIDAFNDERSIEIVSIEANPALTDSVNLFLAYMRESGSQNTAQENLDFLATIINSLEYWVRVNVLIDRVPHMIVMRDAREYAEFINLKENITASLSFRCAPAA